MDLITLFVTSFAVGFSGAIMPGPLLTVTIGESVRRGFIAGPLIVLGHAILEILLIALLTAGLASILTIPAVGRFISVIGGGFLIYMGWGMGKDVLQRKAALDLTASHANGAESNHACSSRSYLGLVLAGVLISLANPYWILWWATVGLKYITMSFQSGLAGLSSFFTGHISADAVWYLAVAAAVAGGRRFMSDKIYRTILGICAIFLLGLGISFIYSGLASSIVLS